MKIRLLNGSEENINLKNYIIDRDGFCKSKFQKDIRDQLIKKYPNDIICEEVYIRGEKFYLDFFIPSLKLIIEVNGRQHKQHVKFFHKTKRDFHEQLSTDKRKKDWADINNFRIQEINYE